MMIESLLAVFVLLQIADWWTTTNVIKSGKGKEGNPLVAGLMKLIGTQPALVLWKAAAVARGGASSMSGQEYAVHVLGALCALYAAVVVNNWKILKK